MLIKVLCPHCFGGLVKQVCRHCDGVGCSKCQDYGYEVVSCKTCDGKGELVIEVPEIFREILSTYGNYSLSEVIQEKKP